MANLKNNNRNSIPEIYNTEIRNSVDEFHGRLGKKKRELVNCN